MNLKTGKPEPPAHLTPPTADWWRSVVSEYTLEPHHLRLLALAAEAWDHYQQAHTILSKEGFTYEDRFGAPKTRPEVAIVRDNRLAFARLIRELGLDVEDPQTPIRKGA